jgi:predicted nucleotidyltransferase
MTCLTKKIESQLPQALVKEIASESSRVVPQEYQILTAELKLQFGSSLSGVILYGSCLRDDDLDNQIIDLYVIVDNYKNAYKEKHLTYLNTVLPPNVFYLEVESRNKKIRTKYSVISMKDFENGILSWFHSYLWARFAQPVRILYARDEEQKTKLHAILACSVLTFLRTTIPILGPCIVDTEKIWINGLTFAYAAELRPERDNRAKQITYLNMGDYIRLTSYSIPALDDLLVLESRGNYRCLSDKTRKQQALRNWRIRRFQGRILSILRLLKATITFRDCVNYAAWKVKRHTGVAINVTPEMRRHPVLKGSAVLWHLVRRGILR